MLTQLTIKNFALIDHLQVSFDNGFTIITGETGAGKSILLGGLSLILGKRADLNSLRDSSKKCIIEAVFNLSSYNLERFFEDQQLDYDQQTIIRREILPTGKSRAFVNDSPVNLTRLQLLGSYLIDLHSQHETLHLVDQDFQFKVIDALAETTSDIQDYQDHLKTYKLLQKEIKILHSSQNEAIKEQDYNSFLLKELEQAKLKEGEISSLEKEYEILNHVEEIKAQLSFSNQLLNEEQIGILFNLTTLKNTFQKLIALSPKYQTLFHQINSSLIDLKDVNGTIEELQDDLEANPERLSQVNEKLTTINNLMQKHSKSSLSELIQLKDSLFRKVSAAESGDEMLTKKQAEIAQVSTQLNRLANIIHKKRTAVIPDLKKQLEHKLVSLGMPNAQFEIRLIPKEDFFFNGKEELSFLFSANKGGDFKHLKKVASGGELSRIMLAIKSILSLYIKLPTIMFDEIDTGVSGEISNKMGEIMLKMSKRMQVFSITHLPQIAAKGNSHYKVYKKEVKGLTTTNLVQLQDDDRIIEIAQMLGGVETSNSALAHAKQLLS